MLLPFLIWLLIPSVLVLLTMALGELHHRRMVKRLPKAQVIDFTAYQHERERRFHRG